MTATASLHPFDDHHLDDPRFLYADLRNRAPVHRIGDSDFWLVSSWDLVQEVVDRPADFSSHLHAVMHRGPDSSVTAFDLWSDGAVGQVLATADKPVHGPHRKLILAALRHQLPLMDDLVARICDEQWHQHFTGTTSPVDWVAGVADQVPIRVIAHLIGLRPEQVPEVLDLTYRTTELLGGVVPPERLALVARAPLDLWVLLDGLLSESLDAPGDHLAGALAAAHRRGEIDRESAVAILIQTVNAGAESTAALIGNTVRLLAEDAALQPQLRERPDLLGALIDESLRLESPFRGHYRHVYADTTLAGTPIPAGSNLLLLWGAANRDPGQFPDPERLDLSRSGLRQHLGFGKGLHFCVGSTLARLETVAAVQMLLNRTSHFSLDPSDPPVWQPSLMMRRHHRLPLQVSR